jgi:hypothetical protein
VKRRTWIDRIHLRNGDDYGHMWRDIVCWRRRRLVPEESAAQLQERARQLRKLGFTVEFLDGGHLNIGASARFAI